MTDLSVLASHPNYSPVLSVRLLFLNEIILIVVTLFRELTIGIASSSLRKLEERSSETREVAYIRFSAILRAAVEFTWLFARLR